VIKWAKKPSHATVPLKGLSLSTGSVGYQENMVSKGLRWRGKNEGGQKRFIRIQKYSSCIKKGSKGTRRARGGGGGGKKVALGIRESSKAKYCMQLVGVFKKWKVKCRPDPYHFLIPHFVTCYTGKIHQNMAGPFVLFHKMEGCANSFVSTNNAATLQVVPRRYDMKTYVPLWDWMERAWLWTLGVTTAARWPNLRPDN